MKMEFAQRLKKLPPYIFAEMQRRIAEKKKEGVDVINLSIGDSDLPPPPLVVDALREEVKHSENHKYSLSQGEPCFRQSVANWYRNRFNVNINPESEVVALIGSKEGIANISRAFINPGDRVLVPDPAYPVYANGSTLLSDGIFLAVPLLEENDFKPDVNAIDGKGYKMMFLNYPNNPTGAIADKAFLKQIVDFAAENDIILCYDNAYSEITFEGYRAPSILEVDGAMDVAIEFHSCSKTFNMTGDRIGFAVGNAQLVKGLTKVKSQIDTGPPIYIQKAAAKALQTYGHNSQPKFLKDNNRIFQERRDVLSKGLACLGLTCRKPKATFYIWANCHGDSMELARKLLDIGVVITPGAGFGRYGDGYVRFSITQPLEKIGEACERMKKLLQ
jgi:LL-diaminopimelate aminotransferase